jgi:hypothetical protein
VGFAFPLDNIPITKGTNNFAFRVKVTPLGWFGTPTQPTGRYTRSMYITTQ